MELISIEQTAIEDRKPQSTSSQFIEANTTNVSLSHLQNDCIIPVFCKDNETTISHHQFIETMQSCANNAFSSGGKRREEIKVSHTVKGRIPEAITKPAKDLQEHEKTIYYERMAFTIPIPTIQETINGNNLCLAMGGVRAYNQENLYSRKAMEKFKVFIGFQNSVCTNLCISTDGFSSEIRASSVDELGNKILDLINGYNMDKHLESMHSLGSYELSEHQFAQLIGKARLYQYLPKEVKIKIPLLELNDGQINTVAKNYYDDENFKVDESGRINLWRLYNLFTGATKSSYIDTFLERTVNAHQLANGLVSALKKDSFYHWFLE